MQKKILKLWLSSWGISCLLSTLGVTMRSPKSALPAIIKSLHEPYDSIQRSINNVVPLKIEGSDFTRVSVAFREKRYYKDGTQVSVRLIDRIFFREGKIRIIQWMGELETDFNSNSAIYP